MDPISVALAVVALATAVKDVVELGQKIHESFAKVPKNLRNAQRVAKDIKGMVEKIQVFYENHKDALDKMENFRVALLGLLNKFRSFEMSILPLLPKTGRRKLDLFIRGWWNNNKIEEGILDLQRDIVQVMLEYMMNSALRGEIKMDVIHQETSRGLEVLEVVRRDVSAIRITTVPITVAPSYESSGDTSDEFTRSVIKFAQSTPSSSLPMLRTPNAITEELMTTAYVKLQINAIAIIVENMSTLPASAVSLDNLDNRGSFQLLPFIEHASMDIIPLRHRVVRQVTAIRDLLNLDMDDMQTFIVLNGARTLNGLSSVLETLGMVDECKLVGEWAIRLARALVDASGGAEPTLCGDLAFNLLMQSTRYHNSGNNIQSLQTVEEAYTIARDLRKQYGEADNQILYGNILLQYGRLVDNPRSIEMYNEAVQVLEDVLNVQAYTRTNLPEQIENVVQHSSSFVDNLCSSAAPITAIRSYATALQRLGTNLSMDNHSKTPQNLQLLGIAVLRKMVSIHGHQYKSELAMDLLQVVHSGFNASRFPAEELVDMVDECIQLYRELVDKNPPHYARQLVSMLCVKAQTLAALNRDSAEAITTWEEAASLAGQILQDSKLCADVRLSLSLQFRRLKKYDDSARELRLSITTYHGEAESRAWRYHHLSMDLLWVRRYKESADAARTSVTLFRHLATRDPARWMGDLTDGLSCLSHCLAALRDYSEALIPWKESLGILDNFLDTNPDECLAALQKHILISSVLEDEEECAIVSFTTIQYLHQLLEIYPQNMDILETVLRAELSVTYNLLRVGRLQDAQQYIDDKLDALSMILATAIPGSRIMLWHASMMLLKVDILDAQGCTEEALLVTQKACNTVKLPNSTHQPSVSVMIESMVREARLRTILGHSAEALHIAEESLRLSRDNKPEPLVEDLVPSLHAITFATLSCQNYTRAAEVAQEGCDILARPEGLRFWQHSENNSFICPSLLAMLASAEANLGRWRTALGHADDAVKASLEIREMELYVSATTAEQSYMETRGNLAEIALAAGDLSRALQICEERSAYFSKRVEKRMGDYRELVPILRMLGVLYCTEGRHEEGDAAAKELSGIVQMLGSAFPSLQKQVKVRLRNQAKVPILKVLVNMSEKLDCGHQAEIDSLFAI